MTDLLKVINLRGGYTADLDILNGIDLSISSGEMVGIIGLNGCGKSTLAKAIVNLIPRKSGAILYKGKDISSLKTWQVANEGVVLMQQGGVVFQNLSVLDNLKMAFRGNNMEMFSRLRNMIPLLAKSERELSKITADRLSGGQRHQLALALTLACNPDIAILDEPSAGLSPKAVKEIYSMLSVIRKELNLTALIVEQNINQAIEFCDRCIFLSEGTVIEQYCDSDKSVIRNKVISRLGL